MALPLEDFRLGISESIDIWLDSVAQANHLTKAAVARDVLQKWANVKAHEHRLAHRRLQANGLQPDLPGIEAEEDRFVPEDTGARRRRTA